MAEATPPAFSAFERTVAFRYLRARRQEGFISVIAGFSLLGIVLGVATLIVTLAVFNGFRTDLLTRLLGVQGHAFVYGATGPMPDYREKAARVAGVPGVAMVTPAIDGQALVSFKETTSGVLVKAIRPEDFARRPFLGDAMRQGTFPAEEGVAIGRRMAEKADIAIGDRVTLVSPQSASEGNTPRLRSYPVTGIFEFGLSELDGAVVLMSLGQAQALFELGDVATLLEVFLADPGEPGAVRDAITAGMPPDVVVRDWRQVNGAFFNLIEFQRNMVFLILAMIVLVAALNIISGMIMLVQDKGREIAILRTMGATRGMILRIFVITGASIGIVGALVGVGLGVMVAENVEAVRQAIQALTGTDPFNAEIYFLSELPAEVNVWEVLQVALMAFALSFLATLYPSWRAARLEPVEVLRHE